jgi:uncharacterized membrane protein
MNSVPPAAAPPEMRKVEAGRGWTWLAEAFDMFRQQPGTWIGILIIYVVILLAAALIPGASLLTTLAGPVFSGGIMLGCSSQASGQGVKVSHLFEGFSGSRLGQLVLLAVIYLGACLLLGLVVVLVALLGFGLSPSHLASGTVPDDYLLPLMLVILVALALYIPVAMGMWLAPALIALDGVEAFAAFKLSFRACLLNFVPFLVYGVVGLVLALLATLPIFLGWLVVAPVFFISIYTSYRDMFPRQGAVLQEGVPPPLA